MANLLTQSLLKRQQSSNGDTTDPPSHPTHCGCSPIVNIGTRIFEDSTLPPINNDNLNNSLVLPPSDSFAPSSSSLSQPSSTDSFITLPPFTPPTEPPENLPTTTIIQVVSATSTFVTFDDNASSNRWSFHSGENDPHITELFEVQSLGSKVKIYGTNPFSSPTRWVLTVTEGDDGVPTSPRFRPTRNGARPQVGVHTEFDRENRFGFSSLSITTAIQPKKFFLVPNDSSQEIVLRETRQFPFRLQSNALRRIVRPEILRPGTNADNEINVVGVPTQ